MKFYTAVLALCAFQGTAAFMGPMALSRNSALSSMPGGRSGESTSTATKTTGAAPYASSPLKKTGSATSESTKPVKNIWDKAAPLTVQGGSLKTFSFSDPMVERVQVMMKTEGRPLNAFIELWQGPDNTPQKMGVYIEDGNQRPFNAVVETPRSQNAICIRNTASLEFPLAACVEDVGGAAASELFQKSSPKIIQGGALKTYDFPPAVESVKILVQTDGRPLHTRIELLQGPNNNKQVMEVYTEDGIERPFFVVLETPGSGNVVRVVNTAPMEFPVTAYVEPYEVQPGSEKYVSEFLAEGSNQSRDMGSSLDSRWVWDGR